MRTYYIVDDEAKCGWNAVSIAAYQSLYGIILRALSLVHIVAHEQSVILLNNCHV